MKGVYIDDDGDRYFASVAEALRVVAGMLSPEQVVALATALWEHKAKGGTVRVHIDGYDYEVRIEVD
jgi:hypothetical protein